MYLYQKLSFVSIIPEGVIKDQLRAQLDGLTGHIGEVFPDLNENSAWLGGTGEAWERGPYYLSGLIPIAFLMNDLKALGQVKLWVEAILAGQREDGNFGPARNFDWWPRMIVLKAFAGYFRTTQDTRILDFMERYFHCQFEQIDRQPLHFWASARGLEAMEAIELLYSYRPQPFLKELVEKLRQYSYDYFSLFEYFPYTRPMTAYISRNLFKVGKELAEVLDSRSKKSLRQKPRPERDAILKFNRGKNISLIMKTHGVNLAMALKYPAVYGAFMDRPELCALSRKGYEQLYRLHGNSTGIFSSDEHLMGPDPAQGVELCAVVEMMYSLEEIGRVTGEPWAYELLEFIAYNTLPAMFTPDMTAHQYVQQANQVACDRHRRQFFDTDSNANTFGVAPNYGCCAANMHAGFPLFAGYLALCHEKGLAFPVYGACTVRTTHNGAPLEVRESTGYPFDDKILFTVVKAAGEVELLFRPISNTDFAVMHNNRPAAGTPSPDGMIHVAATEGDVIVILCKPGINIVTNPDGSKSIHYGNLLMVLGLSAEEVYIKGTKPFYDRGFVTSDSFNVTPFTGDGELVIESVSRTPPAAWPFSSGPVSLTLKGRYVENFRIRKHSARLPYARGPVLGNETVITLVPYGTTRLRISHFPAPG